MKKHILLTAAALVLAGFCAQAEEAAANWARHCKKCHAEDGSGSTAIGKKLEIGDYTDPAVLGEFSDEELFEMTKNGVDDTKMSGYGEKLSDEEIHALVAYMRAMVKS